MDNRPAKIPTVFTVRDAHLHGLSRAELRSSRFRAPWRGVRIDPDRADETFVRAFAAQIKRPDAVVSHSSAAELLGLPVRPDGALHLTTDVDKAPQAKARSQLPGVVAHRSTLTPHDSMRLTYAVTRPSNFDGGRTALDQVTLPGSGGEPGRVRVTTPLRTWIDLASQTVTVNRLVVVGDALVSARYGYCTVADVQDAVRTCRRVRGLKNLRRAAGLIRAGTDSVKESELRLSILQEGFAEPEVNVPVFHPMTGIRVAIPDLQYRAFRIAIEYDGDHHRVDRQQWQHDLVRNDALIDLGWKVLLVTNLTLYDPHHRKRFFNRLSQAFDDQQRIS